MPHDAELRKHLLELLRGGHAHATFEKSVEGLSPDLMGVRPAGLPHSAWELLEHIRITQNDILRFSQSADYVSPKWPEGYWPKSPAPAKPAQWQESVQLFLKDRAEMEKMTADPQQD